MKFKRLAAVLLAAMMVFALAACGGGGEKKEGEKEGGSKGAQGTGKEKVKIALLVGSLGDMSFNDSAQSGMDKAKAEFGDKVDIKTIEYSDDTAKIEPTVQDASEAGYDIIIGSASMQEAFEKYAPDYKDITYILFDTDIDWKAGDFSNIYTIVYKANEASYLGGFLAAKMSDTGVIGFLGGTDQPIISDFLVGYIQGAQHANKDIKVTTSYVGGWADSPKGKELSLAMYNQKASMIFNVAGGSGNGLIEAGVERHKYVLGVDSDQAMLFLKNGEEAKANVIPTSVLKNVGDSLFRAIGLYLDDKLPVGSCDTLGLKENGVGLADNEIYHKLVPEELRNEVNELKEQIIKGEIKVDTAYGKTTDEINQIRDSVKP